MSRLPSLGAHGEGWVTGQVLLMAAVGVAGVGENAPGITGQTLLAFQVIGASLTVLGVVIAAVAVRDLGNSLTPLPEPKLDAHMVETGIYSRVRHPIYDGVIVAALGWALFSVSLLSLIFTVVLAVFFDLKARREEAWLRERYPLYSHYARRVKKFVPGIY